jgi:hypothetical protein
MAETGRQGRFSEPGERVPLSFRVTPEFKRRIDRAAALSGRSTAQEIELRLEASLADAAVPPEIAALAELLARVMTETGTAISGGNRWAGHGSVPWLRDPYATDQALMAARRIIEKIQPEGDRGPHGLFASPDYPTELAENIGTQVADGTIEVMLGRHEEDGSSAALWTPRVFQKLGVIGERLARHPSPKEYFVSATEPAPVGDFLTSTGSPAGTSPEGGEPGSTAFEKPARDEP